MYQKFRSHSFLLPSHFVIANINLQSFQLAAEFKRSFDLYEGQLKALYLSVFPFLFLYFDGPAHAQEKCNGKLRFPLIEK